MGGEAGDWGVNPGQALSSPLSPQQEILFPHWIRTQKLSNDQARRVWGISGTLGVGQELAKCPGWMMELSQMGEQDWQKAEQSSMIKLQKQKDEWQLME